MVPLAERLRPQTLDELVGQPHLFAPGRPMRRIIESGRIPNMIFYGPSGVGKTTCTLEPFSICGTLSRREL